MSEEAYWLNSVAQKKKAKLYRKAVAIESPQGAIIQIGGQSYINFSSNDYLGLANHLKIKKAFQQGIDTWGVGSGASHLISGHSVVHAELEERLAAFTGTEKALIFSTGYMANLGAVSALSNRHGWVASDKLNHASLVDAVQLSRAKSVRYHHADTGHLSQQLAALHQASAKKAASEQSSLKRPPLKQPTLEKSNSEQIALAQTILEKTSGPEQCRGLIVTDAVFSMDGDIAPIHQLSQIARQQSAWLMVDDAHGFGVLGNSGAGTLSELNLDNQVTLYMATLGKALGTFGAFIAGSEALIDFIVQSARTYTYTTALPPALAAASLAALECMQAESWRRDKVRQLARRFQSAAIQLGFDMIPSETPIQSLVLKDTQLTLSFSNALKKAGFWVPAIRPPTVPNNTARLRFSFSASHTNESVEQLLAQLEKIGNEYL